MSDLFYLGAIGLVLFALSLLCGCCLCQIAAQPREAINVDELPLGSSALYRDNEHWCADGYCTPEWRFKEYK